MSRRIFVREYFVFFAWLVLLAVGGCEQIGSEEEFYEMEVPAEKVRQIEVLDLEQMEAEEEPPAEVNEAAAEKLELTLEEARALALVNNLSLKVQLVSPAVAAERVSEEEAKFEWAFVSDISYSKMDTPQSTKLAGTQIDSSGVGLGVRMPLRTGGTVSFDVIDRRTKTDEIFSEFSEALNPEYSTDFSVSISQPLLRNAGNRANRHSIRIAEYDRQIIESQTKLEVIRVLAAVDRAYWRLYAARRELVVRKQQYDLAQAQLEQARRFVELGERALVEVIRAEAGVAERLEGIIVAENSVRDRERELKQILNKPGLETQTPTVLIAATEPDPVHYELDDERMVAAGIENRMEMLELELELAKDISTIDFMRNQALPVVTLDYTYNINGLGPTRSDAYDLLYDKRFEDHSFGLRVMVPLGNEAAKSRLRQAFYQRRQRLSTRERRQTLIELEVLDAVDQLEANWQRILASRQNTVLAGRLFKAEKRQFELGLRTSTDVLDAQTKFAEAQSAEIRALGEYQIAQVDLAFATGTLLGAAKVWWEPIVPVSR
ncbi:MAG: TolC family protein [Planctomycetota bacterium]|nr:MAG: TolC family protein [Planctomycetota bacterium]